MILNKEDGAVVYCQGAFNTTNGKTTHGLVRFTSRYTVTCVVDSRFAGKDAGKILDGEIKNIPVVASVEEAIETGNRSPTGINYFVIGLAPDGGRLDKTARSAVKKAIKAGLNVDSGLHDFLSDDAEIVSLAKENNVTIRDVRKPPERKDLHFFSGKIEQVKSLKIAILGTDSAVGKRTTAWLLVYALRQKGISAELIGTGQTAWMQGAQYGVIMDSLINDFVSGEIEHAVWSAWKETRAEVLIIEGQGSLMNPAYPGGFEILAAGRPDYIIMQHAAVREEYDGFPGYKLHPLPKQIEAAELLSGKPVLAVTLNHEKINPDDLIFYTDSISKTIGLPVFDVLVDGGYRLAKLTAGKLKPKKAVSKVP